MDIKKVGEQIAVLRKSKNLTQSELGERNKKEAEVWLKYCESESRNVDMR